MNAVIVVDDALRERIAHEIRQMQNSHPHSSLAGDLLPQHFDEAVDGVAELIDLRGTDDFEIATIIALSKWHSRNPRHFIRRRRNPNPPRMFKN